jgi:hypothetical protein
VGSRVEIHGLCALWWGIFWDGPETNSKIPEKEMGSRGSLGINEWAGKKLSEPRKYRCSKRGLREYG